MLWPLKKKQTEAKAKVVAAVVVGTYSNAAHSYLAGRMIREKILEEHPFWEGDCLL